MIYDTDGLTLAEADKFIEGFDKLIGNDIEVVRTDKGLVVSGHDLTIEQVLTCADIEKKARAYD